MKQADGPDPLSVQETGLAPGSEPSLEILRYCIIAVMGGSAALVLVLLMVAPEQPERVRNAASVFMVGLLTWFFAWRGQARVANLVMAGGLWVCVTAIVVTTGSVRAPVVIIYPTLVFVVAWMVSSRAALMVAGATMLSTLGLLWIESRGGLPSPLPSSPVLYGIVQVMVYGLSALLAHALVRTYLGRLTELRQVSHHLGQRTQDLEASQADLKQTQAALQGSEARYRTMIEWSPESILVHREGIVLYVNPAAVRMFGAPDAQALLGKRTQDLIHPDHRESQFRRMHSIIAKETIAPSVESRFVRLDGTPIDVEVQGTSIVYDGTQAIHVSIRDITERKQMQDHVRQLAFYDPLTGLPNRRLLDDRLSQALVASKRRTSVGALMFMDLDKLKPINDTHGHEVGDALLIEVARRLGQCVRESDTVARLGGDEFVVMLTDLSLEVAGASAQAATVANQMCAALAQPYVLKTPGGGAGLTVVNSAVSIGLVLFGDSDTHPEALLQRADEAMYQAKKAGGNSVVFGAT